MLQEKEEYYVRMIDAETERDILQGKLIAAEDEIQQHKADKEKLQAKMEKMKEDIKVIEDKHKVLFCVSIPGSFGQVANSSFSQSG